MGEGGASQTLFGRIRSNLGLVVTAAAVIVGVAAVSAYGYEQATAPEALLGSAMSRTFRDQALKSASFSGTVESKPVAQLCCGQTVSFTGAFDLNGTLRLVLDAPVGGSSVNLEVLMPPQGTAMYAKAGGVERASEILTALGMSEVVGGQAEQFDQVGQQVDGQWYQLDRQIIDGLGEDTTLGMVLGNLTKEDGAKLKALYMDHQFIKASQRLADESVDGRDSYHLETMIDRQKLKSFMQAGRNSGVKALQIEESAYQRLAARLDETKFEQQPLHIWIDKSSKYISRINYTMYKGRDATDITVAFKDFNQPVEVTRPEKPRSTLELIGQLIPLLQPYLNSRQGTSAPAAQ